jgi:hypothetical protein
MCGPLCFPTDFYSALSSTYAAAGHLPVQVELRARAHAGLISPPPLRQPHAQHTSGSGSRRASIRSPAVRYVRCRSFPTPPTPRHHPATLSNPSAFFRLLGAGQCGPLL